MVDFKFFSPLLATISLSLTIPAAMVYDFIANSTNFSGIYFGGSVLIIVGFGLVNWSFQQEESIENSSNTTPAIDNITNLNNENNI